MNYYELFCLDFVYFYLVICRDFDLFGYSLLEGKYNI